MPALQLGPMLPVVTVVLHAARRCFNEAGFDEACFDDCSTPARHDRASIRRKKSSRNRPLRRWK
jgi:hypothetical protein